MPNTEFIEEYPLYRKFKINLPYDLDDLECVNIKMYCTKCRSNQTYSLEYDYPAYFNKNTAGQVVMLRYRCAHCESDYRFFMIYIDKKCEYIMKVGQYPPWDIGIRKELRSFLGKFEILYKNGKISESQGYGIAALAYYRRIIEGVIDNLLDSISELLNGVDKDNFNTALEKTKKSKIASEKIAIVKDLLPDSLKNNEFNPLKTLYNILSEGLHKKSDEECLEYSKLIRTCLEYLVYQVYLPTRDQKLFTENMRKLISKRNREKSINNVK